MPDPTPKQQSASPQNTPSKPDDSNLFPDPNAEPQGDDAAIQGEPGQDQTPEPAGDQGAGADDIEYQVVNIGGVALEVDAATAEALQREVDGLKQPPSRQDPAPREPSKPAEPATNDPYAWIDEAAEDLFADPAATLRRIVKETEERTEKRLTGRYQAARTEEQFWNDFYETNDDLKDHKTLVNAVVGRDAQKLSKLELNEAATKLADAVRQEIIRIKGGDAEDSKPKRARAVMRGTQTGTKDKKPEGDSPGEGGRQTMSSIIRKRQHMRLVGGGASG